MKCLKNILPLLLLFIIGCASVEKVNLPKRGDITFVSEGDGTTTVKSMAFYNSGRSELSQISDLKLERNGIVVYKSATVDGRILTFSLVDDILDTQSKATYTIK